MLFKKVNQFYPNEFSRKIYLLSQSTVPYNFLSHNNRATIIRFDWSGHVVATYHAFDGSMYTHVLDYDGKLYLGSLFANHIAKVDRKNHA